MVSNKELPKNDEKTNEENDECLYDSNEDNYSEHSSNEKNIKLKSKFNFQGIGLVN